MKIARVFKRKKEVVKQENTDSGQISRAGFLPAQKPSE